MSHTRLEDFNIHTGLKQNLDVLLHENTNDWDFKILISGDGMTRTGKSTVASQIAHYLDPTFKKNWKSRVVFDSERLIDVAYKIGKNKAIVYDEAREGLDSKRQMETFSKNLLNFFSQCGNLNHFIIIVLPEFFELPKSIAITQSIFLINCYARDGFRRGYFEFHSRKSKRYLFIKGQKFLDYKVQKPDFLGTFNNWIPFDRIEYEELKSKALVELNKKENPQKNKEDKQTHKNRVSLLLKHLLTKHGYKPEQMAEILGIGRTTVHEEYLKGENTRKLAKIQRQDTPL
jgi:hypothetical protein